MHGAAARDEKYVTGSPLTQLAKYVIRKLHGSSSRNYLRKDLHWIRSGCETDCGLRHEVKHVPCQAGVDADPEHVVHYEIGVRQIADDAIIAAIIRRLPEQVTAEQQSRADL